MGDKKKGPVAYLSEVLDKIDQDVDWHVVLRVIDDLGAEFSHYCLLLDM